MDEATLVRILLSTIGTLVGVLVATIAWIGSRIHSRLDAISGTLTKIEKDISKDVNLLSQRLTVIETVCGAATTCTLKRKTDSSVQIHHPHP